MYMVVIKKGLFKRTLKNVVADGIIEASSYRYFILESGERIEFPMTYLFWFSKERNEMLHDSEKKKAGLSD